MRETIPLIGPMQQSRSFRVNNQRTINWLASIEKPGAKSPLALYPTGGLLLLNTPNNGPTRSNGLRWKGDQYFVSGNKLIKRTTAGTTELSPALTTTSGRCTLVGGRNYLMILDGTNGYTYNGTTLAQIADADFPNGATHCDYLDGFFIVNKPSTDEYYISAFENPTAWSALDFEVASNHPDGLLALATTFKDLYLLGSSQGEIHYNSGNPDFPFEPYPGGIIEMGIHAPYSLTKSSLGLIWLADNDDGDLMVVRAVGVQTEVLSDEDMTWQLNQLAATADAYASIYRRAGHAFYTLTFPTEGRTFELDLLTRFWHERKSPGLGRWRAGGVGYWDRKLIVGDYDNGNFYELRDNVYTDNGEAIERLRETQIVHVKNREMTFHELTLEFEPGVGNNSGAGSDPQVFLSYTNDGKNWSSEIRQSIGKIGEYERVVRFHNLGQALDRRFRIRVPEPINAVLVAAYADIEVDDANMRG